MARKAEKRFPRAKTARDRENIRGLLRAAGSRERLIQWIDEETQGPTPKIGRPRNAFDKDFLTHVAQFFGHYWNIDRKRAIADFEARGVKRPRGGFWFPTPHHTLREVIELMWQAHKKQNEDKTLPPAVREASDPRHLGASPEAIVRRLTKQLPKRARTRKTMRARKRV